MSATNLVTIGMDVSDKHSHLVVLDEQGAVLVRDRIATSEKALRRWFARYPGARVALEVGPHSPWQSRLLGEMGLEVIVANPRKVALIHGSLTKNDQLDAERLARLARVDPTLLSPVTHRRPETRAALAMIKSRAALVKSRTLLVNCVRGQVKAEGVQLAKGSTAAFHKRVLALPEELQVELTPLMTAIEALTTQIRHYDQVIEELARDVYPETELLTQVNGVGALTALCYVLTIEEPDRFPSSRSVGSYLGLRPTQDQSGETDKQMHITKAGDAMLRTLLVQCAHRILGVHGDDSDLRRWGLRLSERGGKAAKKRAVIAVARKLAVLLHTLWQTGQVYQPLLVADKANAA